MLVDRDVNGKANDHGIAAVIALVIAGPLFVQTRTVPLLSADLVEAGTPPRAPDRVLVHRGAGHRLHAGGGRLRVAATHDGASGDSDFTWGLPFSGHHLRRCFLCGCAGVLPCNAAGATGYCHRCCLAYPWGWLRWRRVALNALVMPPLLAQAVARHMEAAGLRAELDEVL